MKHFSIVYSEYRFHWNDVFFCSSSSVVFLVTVCRLQIYDESVVLLFGASYLKRKDDDRHK